MNWEKYQPLMFPSHILYLKKGYRSANYNGEGIFENENPSCTTILTPKIYNI